MNTHKPNASLPSGAKLITPTTMQIGGWLEMTMDAKFTRNGVTWYRVQNGMGGRGDREDWVADLPEVCVSVHDYHWNGDSFGPNYGSFENAIEAELRGALQWAEIALCKATEKAGRLSAAINLLRDI